MKRRDFLKLSTFVGVAGTTLVSPTGNVFARQAVSLPDVLNEKTPGWVYDAPIGLFLNPKLTASITTAAGMIAKAMTWHPAHPKASKERCEWGRAYEWGATWVADYDNNGEEISGTRRSVMHKWEDGVPTHVIVNDIALALSTTRRARWNYPISVRMSPATDYGRNHMLGWYGCTEPT